MRRTQQTLRRLLNSRAFASRRGSMLIMVIVILVLLALIGTAMISTSRIDRVSAGQHAINVQVELLLDSAKRLAMASIVQDLFGNNVYKPHTSTTPLTDAYKPQDSGLEDRFLASRVPDILSPAFAPGSALPSPPWPAGTTNTVYWSAVTMPLMGTQFEAPGMAAVPMSLAKNRYRFVPATGSFAGNAAWPMLQVYEDAPGNGSYALTGTIPGADTDGDGIADAGLFKLPVGELNGVTYYVAVRLIDHGSAVNLSTAWKINDDAVAGNVIPGDFFPSNVNLLTFLANAASPNSAAEQVDELNRYRFDEPTPTLNSTPVEDNGANRPDFLFISGYDAFWNQLGRRLGNPGRNLQTNWYKALSESDGAALAYPFGVYASSYGASTPGTRMALSLQTNVPTTKFTGAGSVYAWYDRNFDLLRDYVAARDTLNVRALSVTRSGVSDVAPVFDLTPTLGADGTSGYLGTTADKIPYYNRAANEIVPRTSANTAQFNYLWRAFYNVMVDYETATSGFRAPHVHAGTMTGVGMTSDGRMFRPVLRNPLNPEADATTTAPSMTSFEVMMLRAAIAAVNTIDLRDSDYHVTSRKVVIRNSATAANADAKYEAMVFGAEPQPFITEVFVNTDNVTAGAGGANPRGYVAVELYNPYDVAISLANWQLGILTRQNNTVTPAPANPYPSMRFKALTGFTGFGAINAAYPAPHIIPPGGRVVLENYPNGAAPVNVGQDAVSRPTEAGAPTNVIYVPGLHEVIPDPAATPTAHDGTELVLLRPRRALPRGSAPVIIENDQPCTSTTTPADPQEPYLGTFNEGTVAAPNLYDMVPVDSFDFAGMTNPVAGGPAFAALHYVRGNGAGQAWKHVYPGRYTASATDARHEGTEIVRWDTSRAPPAVLPGTPAEYIYNPWNPPAPNPGANPARTIALGAEDVNSGYANDFPGIQWANADQAGPRQNTAAGPNRFPFGGFARDGDLLQIPFIGAYTIRPTDTAGAVADRTAVLEANSVSMDSQFAEDGDGTDNTYENIGRFTPLSAASPGSTVTHYDWTSDLFDHLAANAPSDDYLPDVDPGVTQAVTWADGTLVPAQRRYPPAAAVPSAVKNSSTANAHDSRTATGANLEALIAVQGKININTASYYVLGQLPWVPNTSAGVPRDAIAVDAAGAITNTSNGLPDNFEIARLIVAYRDGYQLGFGAPAGPFRSIFDLNKIVLPSNNTLTFQNAFGGPPTGDYDDAQGDISPLGAGLDGVRNDYEEQFLMLNRVSNLITTRSDVFTCYLTLMGFRSANTGSPELAVQRSAVMILDRSAVTGMGDTPKPTNVPTE